ncbi:MAG: DUF4091 domain-containing protein [Planctomycetia bacterium]|nr:DUF4091 domain-containing protein [Planctomycetia bacterium]
MKKSNVSLFLIFLFSIFGSSQILFGEEITPQELTSWIRPLAMDGTGYWKKRIDFKITNKTKENWEEKKIELPIAGSSSNLKKDALPLVGEEARALRLCDQNGKELIFNIQNQKGLEFHQGSIQEGSFLLIPVNCEAGKTVSYSLYYDNPQAWIVPDWLSGVHKLSNTGFEEGKSNPDFWNLDKSGDKHQIFWSDENPQSGKKCIKTVVAPGAAPSWIAARQYGIPVVSGKKYLFTAYVRAENVKGTCGWYLHIGTKEKSIMSSVHYTNNSGTFDWKKITGEFTVPEGAYTAALGTVLRGTGTAWFDSVDLKMISPVDSESLSYQLTVDSPKTSPYQSWYPSAKGEFGSSTFDANALVKSNTRYFLLCCKNNSVQTAKKQIMFDSKMVERRWGKKLTADNCLLFDLRNQPITLNSWNNHLFFDAELKGLSWNYLLLIDRPNSSNTKEAKEDRPAAVMQYANGAFPGTSLQGDQSDPDKIKFLAGQDQLPQFISKNNLVKNGNMDSGFENWPHSNAEKDVEYNVVDPKFDLLGKKAIEMKVGPNAPNQWRGFRQTIKVNPGSKYFCGYWISTDSPTGNYSLHIHQHNAKKSLSSGGMGSIGSPSAGKSGWTMGTGFIDIAPDTEYLQLHLTSPSEGTVRYDGVFLVETEMAFCGPSGGGFSGAFQVPGIIKVFPDTTFESADQGIRFQKPASVFLAKNETESMQIALRVKKDQFSSIKIKEPVLRGNPAKKLEKPELNAVGYVLIDFPSGYYQSKEPACFRKVPRSASQNDSWPGLWPDPLIPIADTSARPESLDEITETVKGKNDSFKLAAFGKYGILPLEADQTRSLWLLFKTGKQTEPGIYEGTIELDPLSGGEKITVPYTVEVLNFELPDRPKYTAIYDARIPKNYFDLGSSAEAAEKVREFLVSKRIAPDQMGANPRIQYDPKTETYSADWTEFDRCAARFFNEWGVRNTYLPGPFYLFGWGMPPRNQEKVHPYPGDFPYEKADRSKLDPKFKKIYQAKLKLVWDHMKEKGWADRFVLYISDEPFYSQKTIIEQMKALCAMIHEVDPKIPIYSSTWHYIPEWDGSLNVWGIGHYGIVSKDQIQTIKKNGGRIWWTTDGQMCLDTPYCAVERLLPWWCVQYGADAYEFWGASWYTYNPFDYGSHVYIPQSDRPGVHYYVRYPNGDGYIVYPGRAIGLDQNVLSSIRLEQAREGVEDADWFTILKAKIQKEKRPSRLKKQKDLMKEALDLVPIPSAPGRISTSILSDPKKIDDLRYRIGKILEE